MDIDGKRLPYAERDRLLKAAKAKRARLTKAVPIAIPGQEAKQNVERKESEISTRMNPLQRFFMSLLLCFPPEYVSAQSSTDVAKRQWKSICERLGLVMPESAVNPRSFNTHYFFAVRASLVMEEARTIIAQSLNRSWGGRGKPEPFSTNSILMKADIIEDQGPDFVFKHSLKNHSTITFTKASCFTRDELFHIRPGAIFQCVPSSYKNPTCSDIILGVILRSNREQVEAEHKFVLYFFRPTDIPFETHEVDFYLLPVCHLINEFRSYEAMTIVSHSSPLVSQLVGIQENTTTDINTKTDTTADELKKSTRSTFKLPKLNRSQTEAANQFLDSNYGAITLVQGPPGTGKTTLLVNVICQYLVKNQTENVMDKKRLLVCAPTNKAVTVLASRFMESIQDCSSCQFTAVLVGDRDKLLASERGSNSNNSTLNEQSIENSQKLKSIYLYTWNENLIDSYKAIRMSLNRVIVDSIHGVKKSLSELQKRISNSTYFPEKVLQVAKEISALCRSLKKSGNPSEILSKIDQIINLIGGVKKDDVYQHVLVSADVIFCTLSTAGSLIFRQSKVDIHDMIIDEAAATTEPKLCIPLRFNPRRLLAVGDPKQLPSTIMSRRASDLGLAKSLHERLMYDCQHSYIMLDKQYRMNPQISLFPNQHFYDSRIKDSKQVSKEQYKIGPQLLDSFPYRFVQIAGVEEQDAYKSFRNLEEAKRIVSLILEVRDKTASDTTKKNLWNSADRLRVITFYQAQVNLIKRLLYEKGLGNKIEVATVDSSQGCEADIVLISFVRSKHDISNAASAGFLADSRRLNVALTRAKYQVVCVGNISRFSTMECVETMKALCADAYERQVVVT